MERAKIINDISFYLEVFEGMVKKQGATYLHDSKHDAESFLMEFLNELFKLNLSNANDTSFNEGGVDLIDFDNKIVFQVTATATKSKIVNSFTKADKTKYDGFHFRFFFIDEASVVEKLRLSFSQEKKRKNKPSKPVFNYPAEFTFYPEKDIFDVKSLIFEIGSKPIQTLRKLSDILYEHIVPETMYSRCELLLSFDGKNVIINNEHHEFKNCGDLADKVKYHLNDYISRYRGKYESTHTLLHNEVKVPFSAVYYPLSIQKRHQKTPQTGLSLDILSIPQNTETKKVENNIGEILNESQYIVIESSAGAGKTMLMKHFFLSAVSSTEFIPILIELRNVKDCALTAYIKKKIFGFDPNDSDEVFSKLLRSGQLLFILDGFDEIANRDMHQRIQEIEELVDGCPENCFLITTRPGTDVHLLHRFAKYHIRELSDDDIKEFVDLQVRSMEIDDHDGFAKEIKNAIGNDIERNYSEYLKNPLLLSMFIMTFKSHPELPEHRCEFYQNVFDFLWSKHDANKIGYQHEKKTNLKVDEIKQILKVFSYYSYLDDQFDFSQHYLEEQLSIICEEENIKCQIEDLIYDLTTTISIIIEDNGVYEFPHRTLQEYFFAHYIKDLPNFKSKVDCFYNDSISQTMNNREYLSLWSLIEELDTFCFRNYFLLPKIKEYADTLKLNRDNPSQIIGKLLEISTLSVSFNNRHLNSLYYSLQLSPEIVGALRFKRLQPSSLFISLLRMRFSSELLSYPQFQGIEEGQRITINYKGLESFFNNQEFNKKAVSYFDRLYSCLFDLENYVNTEMGNQEKRLKRRGNRQVFN